MPRTSRIILIGSFVHLISRFVDGRFTFDDEARAKYLERLGWAISRTDWVLVSFALMSSHIHLGLIAGRDSLASWLQPLHVSTAKWLNDRSRSAAPKTLGHVFADRPTTKCYDLTRGGFVITYHHNNTVSAGVAEDPADSTWTSHRAYVGLDPEPPFLDVTRGLDLCGCTSSAIGRQDFHRLVCARTKMSLAAIADLDPETGETRQFPPSSTPPKNQSRLVIPTPDGVIEAAATASGVQVSALYSRSRRQSVVDARRLAALVWGELGGRGVDLAQELGISPSAVSQLQRKTERVEPATIKVVIDRLETPDHRVG